MGSEMKREREENQIVIGEDQKCREIIDIVPWDNFQSLKASGVSKVS